MNSDDWIKAANVCLEDTDNMYPYERRIYFVNLSSNYLLRALIELEKERKVVVSSQ
jgi:hypothetical protein